MRVLPRLWILFATLLAACPSTSAITVDVPAEIPADNASPVTLRATLRFRDVAIADNTDVRFQVGAGSFAADKAQLELTAKSVGGEAQAIYFPPALPGDVDLTVSFTNANREAVSSTQKLKIVALVPADAEQISLGCEHGNVGGLVSGASRIEINCTLTMRDKRGNALPSGQTQFFSEAGVVSDKGAQANGTRKFTYVIDPGAAPPVDVPANAAELAANDDMEGQLVRIVGSRDFNPRDGLATILAVVRGHEAFDDLNGNGVFDDGEPFDDEGEPFLDVDDDGQLTTSFGDKFPVAFDNNGNGVWDGPNGVFDADTKLGRSTHILWTGAPVMYSEPSGAVQIAPKSPPYSINVFVRDDNGNSPAGFDASDKIDVTTSTPASGVLVSGQGSFALSTDLTASYTSAGVFSDLVKNPATMFPINRRFIVTINDARSQVQIDNAPNGVSLTIGGSIRYTSAPRTGSVSPRTVNMPAVSVTIKP